ncbi:hypothetical protein MRX96_016867 [Rhipicephalus microplus]
MFAVWLRQPGINFLALCRGSVDAGYGTSSADTVVPSLRPDAAASAAAAPGKPLNLVSALVRRDILTMLRSMGPRMLQSCI